MSNDKHAYGWMGHIITSIDEGESDPKHNVVAIPRLTWERLVSDYESCKLDERIEIEQLGLLANGEVYYLACGYAFSRGYQHYGTIFEEAEMLEGGNNAVSRVEQAREYMTAMKEIYGVDLPPAMLMVGCSSEH
jgi:hypothetical protein